MHMLACARTYNLNMLVCAHTYKLHMKVLLSCRFKNVAWRLVALFPVLKKCKSSDMKARLWHFCTAKIFTDYEKILEEGLLVKCNDGVIRDIVIVLSYWQGDQPETDCLNCSIQASPKVHCVMVYIHVLKHMYMC